MKNAAAKWTGSAPRPPIITPPATVSGPPSRLSSPRKVKDVATSGPWVDFDVGGIPYRTACATLRHRAGILTPYSQPQPQPPDEPAMSVVHIDRDGPSFRHVLNYLRTGKLPRNMPELERAILEGEGKFYEMTELVTELRDIYPLRQQARPYKRVSPLEHLAAKLRICVALAMAGRAEECQHKLDKLLSRWPQHSWKTIALFGLNHKELHTAALLFGFLEMQLLARGLRPLYLRHLASTPSEDFFLQGECGYRLGSCGLTEEAQTFVEKAVRLHGPMASQVQKQHLKVAFLSQGQFAEVADYALSMLAHFPDDAAVLGLLGVALYKQNKPVEAEATLRRALELKEPGHADHPALVTLGQILMEDRRPEEALRLFEQGLVTCPYDVDNLRMLGQALCILNRPAEAQRWLQRAAELVPDRADILAALGQSLMAQKLYERGRCYLERACIQGPHQASYRVALAHVCQLLGDFSAAETHVLQACKLAPRNAGIACQHGNILLGLGRYQEALTRFNDALSLEPTSVFAHQGQTLALRHFDAQLAMFDAGAPQPTTSGLSTAQTVSATIDIDFFANTELFWPEVTTTLPNP